MDVIKKYFHWWPYTGHTAKLLELLFAILLAVVSVVLCHQIVVHSVANQENKNDYAELNHVKYGLFSVDEWKRQISVILAEEVSKLYLSNSNKRDLRKHVEVQLATLIDRVDKKIRKANAGSAKGWVKQSFLNMFINLKDIKRDIPGYADAIVREITKAQTIGQLRTILNKQIERYLQKTFDTQDTSHVQRIILRTHSRGIAGARVHLKKEIAVNQDLISKEASLLILVATIPFALSGFSKRPLVPSRYMLLVLSLFLLLVAGVTTPTIDMEAKISKMTFVLMGHPIYFENQVLYFQSKSILDVFWIMITHADIQMKLVGALMILFSIVLPVLKLASSFLYYYNYRQARHNNIVKFSVLQSGKWSMADVMVVAIFMAYIGFNGIITSQFGQLSSSSQELVILTTNATSLQPGYYLFLAYTLLALFFSGFLTREPQ